MSLSFKRSVDALFQESKVTKDPVEEMTKQPIQCWNQPVAPTVTTSKCFIYILYNPWVKVVDISLLKSLWKLHSQCRFKIYQLKMNCWKEKHSVLSKYRKPELYFFNWFSVNCVFFSRAVYNELIAKIPGFILIKNHFHLTQTLYIQKGCQWRAHSTKQTLKQWEGRKLLIVFLWPVHEDSCGIRTWSIFQWQVNFREHHES